ncbi:MULTISPECIES: septum formation family protein [unclassified Streptomyces]|uniref:septum formation family protein n=1 Tax=unclassified Streptomyces TaxID=2593676 RepID=UPI000B882A6F|nr:MULTISPECIES: septum formation family protein [unclassified Streptomyces]MYS23319.1 hypothetical protein [Streptomyces sp. SID4948]
MNRSAVTAVKWAWVPGVGILAGRRALREIKWSGETGRTKARLGIAVNTVVTVAVVGGLIAASVFDGPGGNAAELQARQCFTTGGSVVDLSGGGIVAKARTVGCGRPHKGEVTGRWDSSPTWKTYPGAAVMERRAGTECARLLAAYAPDSWRLPGDARSRYYVPTASGWTSGAVRTVVCFVQRGQSTATVGSIHQDTSALTPDQAAYLAAENAYYLTELQKPDSVRPTTDLAAWRRYASVMAAAGLAREHALRARSWPPASAGPVARLEAGVDQAAADWRKAALAPDPEGTDRYVAAAGVVGTGAEAEAAAVRRGLGLADANGDPHLSV